LKGNSKVHHKIY